MPYSLSSRLTINLTCGQQFPILSINILNCPSDQHRVRNSSKVRLYKVLQVFHNFSKISNNYFVIVLLTSDRPPYLAWAGIGETQGGGMVSFFFFPFDWYRSKSSIWTKCEDGSCVLLLPKSSVRKFL